ncbi:hypothetical protein N7495_001438 [Penicillium taxi]|uniref:uncharacterized protein n=1 Tax=Penicillium taxi TaxID=168475 RepID=UPI0025457348|nr:uncharacterized protein N7495_001438 [Penicillium taxi]KAJ5908756.1 hypothetical protein N7495_001438 [Penicillium taxi]
MISLGSLKDSKLQAIVPPPSERHSGSALLVLNLNQRTVQMVSVHVDRAVHSHTPGRHHRWGLDDAGGARQGSYSFRVVSPYFLLLPRPKGSEFELAHPKLKFGGV